MRIRRRNLAWLGITGALVLVAGLSGAANAVQTAALLGLWGGAAIISLLDLDPAALVDLRRSSLTRLRMSAAAKEAADRAARRGTIVNPDLTLLDVGLIATQMSPAGLTMRRTRSLSKDDDGVRPYITLSIGAGLADQHVRIRFEILDHHGQPQYVHEMNTFLRDGEMNILADHQMPLAGNDSLVGVGDGDLRVYVDGAMLGALSFTLAPSLRERGFDRSQRAADNLRVHDDADENVPLSLEELLRSQRHNQGG